MSFDGTLLFISVVFKNQEVSNSCEKKKLQCLPKRILEMLEMLSNTCLIRRNVAQETFVFFDFVVFVFLYKRSLGSQWGAFGRLYVTASGDVLGRFWRAQCTPGPTSPVQGFPRFSDVGTQRGPTGVPKWSQHL